MRYILQCPLKGWDTKTSLADQQEGYATLLDNYIPSNRFLELRNSKLHETIKFRSEVMKYLRAKT